MAQLCYDLTVRFCDLYVDRRSRTQDQMVQAARSGVQNIAEGHGRRGRWSSSQLVANGVLALLNLCCYLLDRQLKAQERAFLEGGGFTERVYRFRRERRGGGTPTRN